MAKLIIKTKEFILPIYPTNVIFVYSNSHEAVLQFAKEERFHEKSLKYLEQKNYEGYSFQLEDATHTSYYHYIIVMKNRNKYEEIDAITHEIAHATRNILDTHCIKYGKRNDEPFAYLTGYLNKEFFKFRDGK